MKYTDRVHQWGVTEGYRVVVSNCKCGWFGDRFETLDEALLQYRTHVKESSARIR